ncbi:MAG: glycosyl hydrolase [Pirellulaceae bacterium]
MITSLVAATSVPLLAEEERAVDLAKVFTDPSADAQPRVYWWWLNSVISKEGITRDLEAMKRKGIAGAMIFDAAMPAGPTPVGPRFMGPPWRKMVQHAVQEADRLGLEISLNLCGGWDSGGPWVTPEHACQKVVSSEIIVTGPQELSRVLPVPEAVEGFYRDIAVQAFQADRSRIGSMEAARPKITARSGQDPHPPSHAIDGDSETFWVSHGYRPGDGPSEEKPAWLQLEFSEPFTAASIYVEPRVQFGPHQCELQCSTDGKQFPTGTKFIVPLEKGVTIPLPETRARFFRLLITSAYSFGSTKSPWNVQVTALQLLQKGEVRKRRFPIRNWRLKAGFTGLGGGVDSNAVYQRGPSMPNEVDVQRDSLVDLSDKTDETGHLTWQVPPGKWTILRIGHTLTGKKVICNSPGGGGYMLDFLSKDAMDLQFSAMAVPLLEDAGPLVAKSLRYLHDDSWEVGSPNWTLGFEQEFKRRRGYDMRPFLAVLTGRIVESRDVSNRFLWDFRRTIGDCIAENHYGRFRELSERYGLGIHSESGGPFFPHIDALKNLGNSEIPMGEFWGRAREPDGQIPWRGTYGISDSIKQAASAAHIYGRKQVQAEAFTTIGPHWEKSPFELKDLVDHAFCQGLTRVMFHTFTHSPIDYGQPGIEYFAGTHFNPNITWWEQANLWTGYIARCQSLLQQRLFVGDVCYYYGEGVPNFVPGKRMLEPSLPFGYDHDVTNAEVLQTRMSVRDGRIVLPDGMSYHMLVLPQNQPMSFCVLRKIGELVRLGATVVGPRPLESPGLQAYPKADQVVETLADQIWGPCDGDAVKEHRFGEGRVITGRNLGEILLADGVPPDFQFSSPQSDTHLDWIHRRLFEADIYFVSNQKNRYEEVNCTFRVSGKVPELFRPDTGEICEQVVYEMTDTFTTVPLRLDPRGSVFAVFRSPVRRASITSVVKDGRSVVPLAEGAVGERPVVEVIAATGETVELRAWEPGNYELRGSNGASINTVVSEIPSPWEIVGPWDLHFAPTAVRFERLISWTEHTDPEIKYFSGTATYRNRFDLPEALLENDGVLLLDLGRVKNFAGVTLNGKALGRLWKPPFRVEITAVVKPKDNLLEIDLTNLWPNRLIGDQFLPENERVTRTNVTKFTQESPLMESGLLGPVRVLSVHRERLTLKDKP